MSLLLDALKKAEQAKRKAQQEKALTPAPELAQPDRPVAESFPSLELAANVEVAADPEVQRGGVDPIDHSSLSLVAEEPAVAEPISQAVSAAADLEFTEPEEVEEVTPVTVMASEQEPATIVFTPEPKPVSEPVVAPALKVEPIASAAVTPSPEVAQRILDAGKKPDSQRRRLVLILLGLLLGLLLGGLYFFGPALLGPSTPALVIPPQASGNLASPPMASAGASVATAIPATSSEVVKGSVAKQATVVPRKKNSQGPKRGGKREQRPASPSAPAGKPVTATEATSAKGPVLENTTPQPGVAPLVAQGYAAYQRGDLEQASKKYRQAVNEDDQNRDALLGLAATSRRLGDLDTARRAYKQLLYLNPRDVDAKAGLSAIQGVTDPQSAVESIRPLSERETDSAPVQSELGAMYVRQGRWSEAQAAYFNAFSANPANPDLAFNLAICLDHLNQPKLALDYYRKAQQLGARNPHRFDSQQLNKRISELEGIL